MDSLPGESCSNFIYYTRKEIFLIMQDYLNDEFDNQIMYLEEEISKQNNCFFRIHTDAKLYMFYFFSMLLVKWQEAQKNIDYFLKKNEEWLKITVSFPTPAKKLDIHGRDDCNFYDDPDLCDERSKRRKIELAPNCTR
ncbi:hypothetical protein PUN28_001329 [Cardiocondyla obscurior]|uniref:Uncharacterized protein n=1 Tax=Cardiocondyla obscurior TaxID=286306 RepID=A0AAW2H4G9_9HYME